MGLFDFIRGLIFGSSSPDTAQVGEIVDQIVEAAEEPLSAERYAASEVAAESFDKPTASPKTFRERKKNPPVQLRPLEYRPSIVPTPGHQEVVQGKPYPFASIGPRHGLYLDLSRDADERWLEYYGLPTLRTPQDLADWLEIPLGRLAWLTHRTREKYRPRNLQESHYHYKWIRKRSGGLRLIEAPKEELKAAQLKVLCGILDVVPAHPAAHGFVSGRSIVTNAEPHVGSRFLLKMDLENFYPSVKYSRVVAIFRSFGFSREVSLWLARLTVTAPPWGLDAPKKNWEYWQLMTPHLPQGAPTSPALANLSAFGLDVRLSGLAKSFNLRYTRYADDLTFSGPGISIPALHDFIPLSTKIIVEERFQVNRKKRKVIRDSQRQSVTGVVVNEKVNVSRQDYDRLKAILHNCIKHGPESQNRDGHAEFSSHLRGRIAHVMQLNPRRGGKLLELFAKIRWT